MLPLLSCSFKVLLLFAVLILHAVSCKYNKNFTPGDSLRNKVCILGKLTQKELG
ncbi:hypothetical protein Nmel_009834 [Mimus melanotis]